MAGQGPWTPISPSTSDSSRQISPAPASSVSSASASKPRKRPGQVKSRTGCYNCKRRKVKCNEHWPECDSCKRLKLECEYPWSKRMRSAHDEPSAPLRTTPAALTLEDLRFYHHFMTTCYPRWPSEAVARRIWGQAAAMSSNFDCLAHAILAVGATFLSASTDVDYSFHALRHRTTAMQLVNQRFAASANTMDTFEGDALIGAVLCLSTQSVVMPDGWRDFFTLNRGIVLMHMTCIKDHSKSIFTMLDHGNGTEGQTPPPDAIREYSQASLDIVKVFKGCLLLLRPHTRHQQELNYFNHLWSIAQVVGTERLPEAWKCFEALNLMMFMMSPEDHSIFVDEKNHVAQLFMAFTAVADFLMRWGPLEPHNGAPPGLEDHIMRQTVNQRAVVKMLWRTALGLPARFHQCKVAVKRLADDFAKEVGLSSQSPDLGSGSKIVVDRTVNDDDLMI
ncbi:unnamed protein product [Discula destructiva]